MEEKQDDCEQDHHKHDEAHCHAYGTEHEHTHEGGHEHVHRHTHEHTHDGVTHTHEHEHVHSHAGGQGTMEEDIALLAYMADHNHHHADEIADLGNRLRSKGMEEAADMIKEGVKAFTRANELFAEALKLVKRV